MRTRGHRLVRAKAPGVHIRATGVAPKALFLVRPEKPVPPTGPAGKILPRSGATGGAGLSGSRGETGNHEIAGKIAVMTLAALPHNHVNAVKSMTWRRQPWRIARLLGDAYGYGIKLIAVVPERTLDGGTPPTRDIPPSHAERVRWAGSARRPHDGNKRDSGRSAGGCGRSDRPMRSSRRASAQRWECAKRSFLH